MLFRNIDITFQMESFHRPDDTICTSLWNVMFTCNRLNLCFYMFIRFVIPVVFIINLLAPELFFLILAHLYIKCE